MSPQQAKLAGSLPRLLLLLFVLGVGSGCGRVAENATLEKLRAAESQFASATEPKQFETAAETYHQVTGGGFVSGGVLFNQGNAFMKSAQPGRAIASYREALRYLPRDAKLIANLESALGRPLDADTDRTLLDYLFVWQRTLSYREKFQLTTLFLIATLGSLWYWRWHRHSASFRRLAVVTGTLCLLFASSSMLDCFRYETQLRGVLVERATPRKGNSENYEPAFTKSLSEGTEFVVTEQRGDWLRVTFGDNAEGWILADSSVVY